MVSSAVNGAREAIGTHLKQFNNFHDLWISDRDPIVNEFLEQQPLLTDWKQKVMYYDSISDQISELPTVTNVGAIHLDANNVKESLQVEAKHWKVALCRALNGEYRAK